MSQSVKESVLELAQRLPDDCTWDEVMYHVYVRQKIAAGLSDVAGGRLVPHEEVFREFARDQDQMDTSGPGSRRRGTVRLANHVREARASHPK